MFIFLFSMFQGVEGPIGSSGPNGGAGDPVRPKQKFTGDAFQGVIPKCNFAS